MAKQAIGVDDELFLDSRAACGCWMFVDFCFCLCFFCNFQTQPPLLLNVDLWHWHYVDFMLRCIDGFWNGQFDSCLFQDSTADASCSEANSGKHGPHDVTTWFRDAGTACNSNWGWSCHLHWCLIIPPWRLGTLCIHIWIHRSAGSILVFFFWQPEHLEVEVWCILVKVYCKDFCWHASDPCMEHFGRKCPIVSSNSATWTKFAGVSSVIFDWKCPALAGLWWSLCSYRIGNVRYASMNRFLISVLDILDIQTSLEVLSKISVA